MGNALAQVVPDNRGCLAEVVPPRRLLWTRVFALMPLFPTAEFTAKIPEALLEDKIIALAVRRA
jgi:hypothetical protein